MPGGRQTFTILIIFVAVLMAYHQRNGATVQTAQQVADAASSAANFVSSAFAGDNAAPTGGTTAPSNVFPPNSAATSPVHSGLPIQRRPNTLLLKILAGIPSPFPYLGRFMNYQLYLFYTFIQWLYPVLLLPLRLLWDLLLLILDPVILVLSTAFYYFVAVPTGMMLAVAQTLYPVYIFAASAIFLGGLMGACGGFVHSTLINPWIGTTKAGLKTELDKADTDHYDYEQVAEDYGDRKGKSVPRVYGARGGSGRERYELDEFNQDSRPRLSPERENLLRGWRESVW